MCCQNDNLTIGTSECSKMERYIEEQRVFIIVNILVLVLGESSSSTSKVPSQNQKGRMDRGVPIYKNQCSAYHEKFHQAARGKYLFYKLPHIW